MLAREISADHIYLACGHTDMRKSIDGLVSIVSSDTFKYLTYLFTKLPNMDFKIHPELLDSVLPWKAEIQQNCK